MISLKRKFVVTGINELDQVRVGSVSVLYPEHDEWRPPEDVPEPGAPQEVPAGEPETPPTPPAEEPPGPDEVPERPPESIAA